MERKIIKQGNNAYTITLPIKWVRQCNLENKDVLNITQDNTDLIISSHSKSKPLSVELNLNQIKQLNEATLKVLLTETYRKGYDSIKLITNKHTNIISRIVRNKMMGFEVTEITKTHCLLQNIAEPSQEQFEVVFRKLFFLINQTIDMLISKSYDELRFIKDSFDSLTNYCRRMISKHNIGNNSSYQLHNLIYSLSAMMHDLFYMQDHLQKQGQTKKTNESLTKIKHIITQISKLIHKKDVEIVEEILTNVQQLNTKANIDIHKEKNKDFYAKTLAISSELHNATSKAAGYVF